MKKTHLYGAVAATMLLAPVTANVLAEEGETPSETTLETQNSEELTEQPVLPSNEEKPGTKGLSDEAGVPQGDIEQDDSDTDEVPEEDAGNFYGDEPVEDGEEVEIPEEEGKTDNEVWTEEEKEVNTIPAEEMYIPDPVTLDEEIDIRINYETSDIGTLNTWMESLDGIKVAVHERGTSEKVYEKNFSIDLSKFDMSHLSELQFFNGEEFRSYFYYDMNDIIATIEKESKLDLKSETNHTIYFGLNYDYLNKKWKLNANCETEGNSIYLSYTTATPPTSVKDYYPDLEQATEEDLDDELIIQDFYNSLQSFIVTLDDEEIPQVELTRDDFTIVKSNEIETVPERATGMHIPNSVTIRIDTNALAKKLNLSKNTYYIASKYLEEGIDPTIRYSLMDSKGITMYFTTNGNWKMANASDSNLKINYETLNIDEFLKEMDSLTSPLKVHIYDISDQNKVTEFEYDPKNTSLWDSVNMNEFGIAVRGQRTVAFDRDGYLKKYEELKNGKYKLAVPQTGGLYKQLAYNSTLYSALEYQTELVIYVEKDTLSENQYANNGVQLSAKADEDLYGLEFKAENTKSDNNFGFDSTNETVGYTLSFVNRQGEEVQRTGAFEVQMPIPTEWAGKVLKVYQVDQTGNKELLSILMDGKVIFTPATLSTFVLVKEAEPETPIKTEATFTQDGYQVKAESKEDLTGLQIVIDEVEADNNFGLSSDYQTIGYDIHFENEEGKEVSRNGKFTVRIPIPEEFMGKEVRLFHKENKDSAATELQFKVVDDKYYEFETTSFSLFVIVYDGKDDNNYHPTTPNDPTPSKPNHTGGSSISNNNQVNIQQLKVVTGTGGESSINPSEFKIVESGKFTTDSANTAVSTGIISTLTSLLVSGFGISLLSKKRKRN